MAKNLIHITTPETKKIGDIWTAKATVDGYPLWFKCNDTELTAVPEAFLTAMFIPALHQKRKLTIDAAVDPAWFENTENLIPIYKKWWDYPLEHPLDHTKANTENRNQATNARSTALCFTGGADSFYSLLKGDWNAQYLLFVRGFDISLTDEHRYKNFKQSLDEIAKETGKKAIIISTNLREHPTFKQISWERTHGAALATVAHLLTKSINTLVIPSSNTYEHSHAWGSHWQTDPFWGVKGQLKIIHGTNQVGRVDKIFSIAQESIVQHHLRVCWQNLGETVNCSCCEKCLRTMVALETSGYLKEYVQVFETKVPVYKLLNNLSHIPYNFLFIWNDLLTLPLSGSTRSAIQRLIKRSKRAHLKKQFKKGWLPFKFAANKIGQAVKKLSLHTADKS